MPKGKARVKTKFLRKSRRGQKPKIYPTRQVILFLLIQKIKHFYKLTQENQHQVHSLLQSSTPELLKIVENMGVVCLNLSRSFILPPEAILVIMFFYNKGTTLTLSFILCNQRMLHAQHLKINIHKINGLSCSAL